MLKKYNREYKIKGRVLGIQINANIEYQVVPEHLDTDWNLYMRACKTVKDCMVLPATIYSDRKKKFVEPSQRLYEFIEKKFIEDTIYYG